MASKTLPLTLPGIAVNATHDKVPVGKIRLNPENPRIRFLLQQKRLAKAPSEKALIEIIRDQPGYDGLQKAIRKAGGIYDPIIVDHTGLVIEGNTRATVFKVLHDGTKADSRWQKIPVLRLPRTVPESSTALLMGSYHIGGKTTWRAYAQADHIYQLKHKYKLDPEQIADETRMSKKEVEQYIDAYDYLVKEVLPKANGSAGMEILEKKFSHALEFIKNKKLAKLRADPKVRAKVATLIVDNKIKGAEVRHLDKVLKNRQASSALKTGGFKAAKAVLNDVDPASGSKVLKEVRHLTASLNSMSQDDIETIKKSAKARDLLVALNRALRSVASVTGVKFKDRNG